MQSQTPPGARSARRRPSKPHPLDDSIRQAMRDAAARDEAMHGSLPELRAPGAGAAAAVAAAPRVPAAAPTPPPPRPVKGCTLRLRLPAGKVEPLSGLGRLTAAASFRLLDDGRVEWKVTALYRGAGGTPLPDDLAGRKLGEVGYQRWLPWPDAKGRPSRVRARTLDRAALAAWLLRAGIADPQPGDV